MINPKVYAMIANGTEETECLTVVDLLRRGGVDVVLTSVEKSRDIISSHKIKIEADATVDEVDFSDGDMIFIPGGMPGSERISACVKLIGALHDYNSEGKHLAAICAAPGVVLGRHGFLKGKTATCYPGFEDELTGATYTSKGVVTDSNITTARGLGFAIDFALELLTILQTKKISNIVKNAIQYK